MAVQDTTIAKLNAMIEQLTLERQGMILPIHNLTTTESARPVVPSQAQGGYTHYILEYAFATLPGAALAISVAPNVPTPQRPPIQGLP